MKLRREKRVLELENEILNAAMETFWSTIKREIAWSRGSIRFATRADARLFLFKWFEVFYNRQRRPAPAARPAQLRLDEYGTFGPVTTTGSCSMMDACRSTIPGHMLSRATSASPGWPLRASATLPCQRGRCR